MKAGLPTPEADTGGPFGREEAALPPESSAAGPTRSIAHASASGGMEALRDALARTMDPIAYDPRAVAVNLGQSWDRFTRRQVAEAHAEAAITDGWVRVSEDDDTIERVARKLAAVLQPSWDPLSEHMKEAYRRQARAAVQALREET